MSIGGKEDSIWMVEPVKKIAHEIRARKVDSLNFKSFVYSNLDHMDVPVLIFTKGLQELNATR